MKEYILLLLVCLTLGTVIGLAVVNKPMKSKVTTYNEDCGLDYCKWRIRYDNEIAGLIHNENYLTQEWNKIYDLIYSDLTVQEMRDSLEAMEVVADTVRVW